MEFSKRRAKAHQKNMLGNVKLISCLGLHIKKFNARCSKMIFFLVKEVDARK